MRWREIRGKIEASNRLAYGKKIQSIWNSNGVWFEERLRWETTTCNPLCTDCLMHYNYTIFNGLVEIKLGIAFIVYPQNHIHRMTCWLWIKSYYTIFIKHANDILIIIHHHHPSAAEQATTSFLNAWRSLASVAICFFWSMPSLSPIKRWMYVKYCVLGRPAFLLPWGSV